MAGCYFTPNDSLGNGGNGGNGSGSGNGNGTTSTGSDGGTTSAQTGVPCDVAQALSSCLACHGSSPIGGAPMSLASYADLTAPSAAYPGQTEAQRSVARMSGNPSVMPPGGPAPAQADIDTVNAWISAGYPQGSCGSPSSDGGPVNDPYNTATVCTSGKTGTTSGSSSMRPGEACISCHSKGEGPIYPLMGTIYPTAHEPNDCVGASSGQYTGVQIIATDSQNHSVTLTPNSAGNFMGPSTGSLSGAYTIKIKYQGRERDMVTPQTSGDCNSCHTEKGTNNAPGRIMLP
jgi:cytochrome c553